jgi:aspartyl/asparaginyl beta-hydroxylase (cupin superfamily)
MTLLPWIVTVASGLLFGQLQNFGHPPPDPEEKKRGEKMISQAETMIAQSAQSLEQSRRALRQGWLAIVIAILALVVAVVALFRHS